MIVWEQSALKDRGLSYRRERCESLIRNRQIDKVQVITLIASRIAMGK